MSYLGSWKIDDLLTFPANTHRFDTGAATDADSAPTYRVYENETATPILTGTMALLDGGNTAGFYTEQITLSVANDFEKGKSYTIYISATVNSVTATTSHTFQLEAEVDANIVSDKTGYALTSAERNSIATALLDLTDGIEVGLTPRGALRLIAAACAGVASGLATATAVYRNAVANSKARITATVDADGNRSAVTTDVT